MPRAVHAEWDEEDIVDWVDERPARRLRRRRLPWLRIALMSCCSIAGLVYFAGIDPLSVIDIQEIILQLRERGIGILITDHNAQETLRICDRAYLLTDGAIFHEGSPAELAANDGVRQVYLGERFRLAGSR